MDFNQKEIENDQFMSKKSNYIDFLIQIDNFDLLFKIFDLLIDIFDLLINIFDL